MSIKRVKQGLPDARSSRQDRSESVAMRWLKGSMRLRSRFLFLSKQALLDPVKTADIHLIQSKAGIPN